MTPLTCVIALVRAGVIPMTQAPKTIDYRVLENEADAPSPLTNRERFAAAGGYA